MAAATAHRSYLQAGPRYFGLFAVLLLGFAAFIKFRDAGIMIYRVYIFSGIYVLYSTALALLVAVSVVRAAYHTSSA